MHLVDYFKSERLSPGPAFQMNLDLPLFELQEMLYVYVTNNVAFFDARVVISLLQVYRKAIKEKARKGRSGVEPMLFTDVTVASLMVKHINGTVKWASRLSRAKLLLKLFCLFSEDQIKALLSKDLNYSERNFGLAANSLSNPVTALETFHEEFNLPENTLATLRAQLIPFQAKLEALPTISEIKH